MKYAAIASLVLISVATFTAAAQPQHYTQTNLVSDQPGVAAVTDPNLVNPWCLSRSPGGDWWVSDNGTGLSTLYDGTGKIAPLVVQTPGPDPSKPALGTPTGTIFHRGKDFEVAPKKPSIFLFVTEDDTVSGWNPGVDPSKAILKVNQTGASLFKGATSATIDLPYFGAKCCFIWRISASAGADLQLLIPAHPHLRVNIAEDVRDALRERARCVGFPSHRDPGQSGVR